MSPTSPVQKKKQKNREKAIALMRDGKLTNKQIAIECNCSEITICRIRRAAGIKNHTRQWTSQRYGRTIKLWKLLEMFSQSTNDKEIANELGCPAGSVLQLRQTLGFYYGHKGKWSRNSHPKGFKGKTHSQEIKKQLSVDSKALWADPNHTFNSDEHRQKMSDNSTIAARQRKTKNTYSSAKRGYREDLGKIFFRSRWEANYARYLNLLKSRGEIFAWEFEAETFWFITIKRGVRSYCPDFKIWEKADSEPYYIEVKGWMDAKSKTKLDRMARYFPRIKIVLVDEKAYNSIKKNLGSIIPGGEK